MHVVVTVILGGSRGPTGLKIHSKQFFVLVYVHVAHSGALTQCVFLVSRSLLHKIKIKIKIGLCNQVFNCNRFAR